MAIFPMLARDEKRTVPGLSRRAELSFNPISVMVVFVLVICRICSGWISVGVAHGIGPPKYLSSSRLGVPPPVMSQASPSGFHSHPSGSSDCSPFTPHPLPPLPTELHVGRGGSGPLPQ